MKAKNSLLNLTAILICLLCLTITATAQKRRKTTRKTAKPAATAAAAPTFAEIRAGAQKVSIQVKNVSKFIYLLGSIAQGIEDVDRAVKDGKATRVAADQNAKNKENVLTTLRNLRAGLVALEIEFRTNAALRSYLRKIQGISEISGAAEDQAAGGHFRESGKTLLQVIEKLSDTLVAMP
ncbi:MAG: hypothetical protein ACR2L1_03370 [Pyrinomonadaceae bacterium]